MPWVLYPMAMAMYWNWHGADHPTCVAGLKSGPITTMQGSVTVLENLTSMVGCGIFTDTVMSMTKMANLHIVSLWIQS